MDCTCIKKKPKISQDKHREENVLGSIFSEYCSKTSVHGIGYLGEKNGISEKLWWILMFLLSMAICSIQINKIWQKWDSNPVITSVSKNQFPTWKIPFPAVTICPFNKIDRKVYRYKEKYLTRSNLSIYERTKFYDVSLLCNDWKIYNQYFNHSTNETVLQHIREVSTSVNFLVKSAKLNGKSIRFYNHITADGLCYTYNSFSQDEMYTYDLNPEITFIDNEQQNEGWSIEKGYPSQTSTFTTYPRRTKDGVKSGMRLRLQSWTISREYACGEPVSGYKITLHNPAEYPKVGQQYILAPLKKSITVSVDPKVVTTTNTLKDLSIEARNCYFSNERILKFFQVYTLHNCRMECITNITRTICGCVAYFMPKFKWAHFDDWILLPNKGTVYVYENRGERGTPTCGDVRCVNDVESETIPEFDVIRKYKREKGKYARAFKIYRACNCLLSCASLSYDYETSQADNEWRLGIESKLDHQRAEIPLSWYEYTYVDIFFKEPVFMTLQRSELYGQSDFLASCGGLLGLFMGFSFLSLIELIYFFTVRLWCRIKRNEIIPQTHDDKIEKY